MENKCEELGIRHAWTPEGEIDGFTIMQSQTCANCGLKRTRFYESKEWYSYSDGREDEIIVKTKHTTI